VATQLREKTNSLRAELTQLQGREEILTRNGPVLRRRQLGTVLGSVGIHKNKHVEQDMNYIRQDITFLRAGTNKLLEMEHLEQPGSAPHELGEVNHDQDMAHMEGGDVNEPFHDDEAGGEPANIEESGPNDAPAVEEAASDDKPHLQRRQLGIILTPIAMAKSKKQQQELQSLQDEAEHIRADLARVRTSQDVRMRLVGSGPGFMNNGPGFMNSGPGFMNRSPSSLMAVPVMNAPILAPRTLNNGVMGSFESRGPINGPTSFSGPVGFPRGGNHGSYGSNQGHDDHHDHRPAYGAPSYGGYRTSVQVNY